MMIQKLLLIAVAGGLGTLSRYGLTGLVQRLTGPAFPWGTFIVNVAGSFLFGVVWVLTLDRGLIPEGARPIILTGFMGAFTTFSTYMFETGQLARSAEWWHAAANLVGQPVVGMGALLLGFAVARLV